MKVLGDVTRESVDEFVKEFIDSKTVLFTNKKYSLRKPGKDGGGTHKSKIYLRIY